FAPPPTRPLARLPATVHFSSAESDQDSPAADRRSLGPAFVPAYAAAEGVSLALNRPGGCGNIYEILAGLKTGGYDYCY
ncbi:hypothetical protein ACPEH0_14600, partial [Microbacterium sp. NPDC079356]